MQDGRQDKTPTGGKRRQRRKDARPAEIIAAAMELWKDKGFAATRLEDVARGAGVAKGTIYLYFASKEALFEAAVEDRVIGNMDRARQAADLLDGPTEDVLLAFFERIRSEMVEGGSFIFLKVLLAEGHRFPDLVARYEANVLRRGFDTVQGILRRGVARGDLRPEAADVDPRLVMAPAMMLSLWGTVFQGVPVPDVHLLLRQHVTLLLGSLGRD
ncbi:TetR/AcrR family transcriptional regulator [Marinibacterium sp. SX1]|uniref:TetR/AcrR family transcriptional regulator n=1 Tax=Marinibacterium sp. SX1 TaxID=3388424 RepID=UPI003D186996